MGEVFVDEEVVGSSSEDAGGDQGEGDSVEGRGEGGYARVEEEDAAFGVM